MNENRLDSGILLRSLIPFGMFICLVFFYWPTLIELYMRWDSGDNNYCYLVIPLFAYLLWDKRSKPSADGGRRLEGSLRLIEALGLRLEGKELTAPY